LELVEESTVVPVVGRIPPPSPPTSPSPSHYTKPSNEKSSKNSRTAVSSVQARQPKSKLSALISFVGTILSAWAQQKVCEVIDDHPAAFVAEDGVIGCFNGDIVHKIDLLPGSRPFKQRPYRLSPAMQDEVRKQIEQLLKQGIIRESSSEFASPIVMVPKRDGSWRFAVDYRRLNALTHKQTYLLPLVSEILDQVGGKTYYSIFDLASGFHQTKIHPAHQQRTSFITFMGQYEHVRCPFGLASAPHTFQRIMDTVRRHLNAAILIYIDDIILCSDTEEDHLTDLEEFLGAMEKFNLKMRIDKCAFGRGEIRYLGFLSPSRASASIRHTSRQSPTSNAHHPSENCGPCSVH
jgi:hypothetical protein